MKYSMILKSPKDYTAPGNDHDKILDFVIECIGDYNSWSFAGEIRSEIKRMRNKEAA